MPGSPRLHRARPARAPLWLWTVAVAFALYFLLLVVSNARRPGPTGLLVSFDEGGALAVAVHDDSSASRAGLRAGDRITRYAGRRVRTRRDWLMTDANLSPDQAVDVVIERAGRTWQTTLAPAGRFLRVPPRPATVALGIAMLGQCLTLVLAAMVAFRRFHERLALLGAWLLGSFGVFTVVLPFGLAYHWRLLPGPLQWLLWIPFLSGAACGVLFFAFCAEFPRRVFRSSGTVVACCAPALVGIAWHAHVGNVVLRHEGRVSIGGDWSGALILLNVTYFAAGLGLLTWHYRRLRDQSERRRLSVLRAGCAVGAAAGMLVALAYWVRPTPELTYSLFGSPLTLVGVPLLLAAPGSIAYTILRNRLFDVSLIVRQGVRHALARRLLLSLAPLLLGWLALDLLLHGRAPLLDLLRVRGGLYGGLTALLIGVLVNRDRWLEAIDRRFFHSRYQAQQILRDVAAQLREATDPHEATMTVVRHVEAALYPQFVAALGRTADDPEYATFAAAPSGAELPGVRADSRLVALAHAVGKPLDLSPDQDEWIDAHLPDAEAEGIRTSQLELLVPVTAGHANDVLLALGPRRSEEPYAREDIQLLEAIAASLALVLERTPATLPLGASLAECPVCATCFDTSRARCPADHALLMVADLPVLLGGRYRLVARLGEGGMGTVYSAVDESLGRRVAVKVLADHLVGSAEAAHRFQQEARTTAAFGHPNAVAIHDVGVTGASRAFLVMELLSGETLRARLASAGPLAPERVLSIVTDLCSVLDAAHAKGLVHRDLKPDNVFLARLGATETTKLLDFGIAKVLETQAPTAGVSTGSGVLVGSLPYMAPEQMRGEPVHPLWDLWALAVTTHEILTGHRPVHGAFDCAWTDNGAPPSSLPLPPPLRTFFATALAADSHARPQTAAAFRGALAAAIQSANPARV